MSKRVVQIVVLSFIFVLWSFFPSLYEIEQSRYIPSDRYFVLEHNYLFDYNFYLSRIREGQQGRWLVTEAYYNQPHPGSLFQVWYLWVGKIGGLFSLSPPVLYHVSRVVVGLSLLISVGFLCLHLFPGIWGVLAYLCTVLVGSWPILVSVSHGWRFGTYMGWWSVIDSLQRITTLPHVLVGQLFLVIFLWVLTAMSPRGWWWSISWGVVGCIGGIIFPPTLLVVYTACVLQSMVELLVTDAGKTTRSLRTWVISSLRDRGVFFLLSFPSLVYAQMMFRVMPWKALALFDVQHRINLPYDQYQWALGPFLYTGLVGLILLLIRRERALLFLFSWVGSIGILFIIFEYIPTQSPLRFTESLLHVPLGISSAYLWYFLWENKTKTPESLRKIYVIGVHGVFLSMMSISFLVMVSMMFWKMDEAVAKRYGTWPVPIANQLAYPLKDFMAGIFFLRDHVSRDAVVLSYVTAGNYIPAYAGQHVYIGHANTPDEDKKEPIAKAFFSGEMSSDDVRQFLKDEHISYVFYGPQERAFFQQNISEYYSFLENVYENNHVTVYRVK